MSNDLIQLLAESIPAIPEDKPWGILVVDDDRQIHQVTALALDGYRYKGRPVHIFSAHSGKAAHEVLAANDDIALILLDVVMESEHAGLELVQFIRTQQRNSMVRIVLRTGQPGQAPALDVIQEYDIDDYRTKTELTFERLYIVVTSALRTYDLLQSMDKSKQELAHLANHDSLTGLPNRSLLNDRISQALTQTRRTGRQVAILFIDIDGFKYINDSFGHTVGDGLLKALAARMVEVIREGDTVARLGGDEFVIVLNGISSEEDASQISQKLLKALPLPLLIGDRSILITASIGISIFPRDGSDPENLLKNADVALYAAKQRGKNCAQAYNRVMSAVADERVIIENALRQALDLGQFELYYQPRVEISTGVISGVEALIRWTHPSLGIVPPLHFIGLAEEIGLIVPIGEWVLSTACNQLHEWRQSGHHHLTIAVNMSVRQFYKQDIVAQIQETLQTTEIPATALELEVTESVLIGNPESVVSTLHALKALGVSLSMDDFGTGYSSLSYLNRFPIDAIKIDQSFTSKLTQNMESASIVRAIITLARSLNMRTIGEGVETAEQAAFMRDNGCDAIQGHYFCRALSATDLTKLLAQYQPTPGVIESANTV